MRTLVTGGKGFIGSVLADRLISLGHDVDILDLKLGQDVLTYERNKDYDIVFHLISLISEGQSFSIPEKYFDVNAKGTFRIMEMFKDTRVVNISSCVAQEPITSPYGLSKKVGEVISAYYPNALTTRLHNIFGERETNHIIYIWAKQMLCNEEVFIFGDGTEKRDYVYVDDAIDVIVGQGFNKSVKGLISVGYGKAMTSLALFKKMSEILGYKKEPVYRPMRIGDCQERVSEMVWQGKVGFEEGLKRTLKHYKEILC